MSARQEFYQHARHSAGHAGHTSVASAWTMRPLSFAITAHDTNLVTPTATAVPTMKTSSTLRNPTAGPLEKGQLWKVDDAYLQIVELGKRLIHYKLMKKPD